MVFGSLFGMRSHLFATMMAQDCEFAMRPARCLSWWVTFFVTSRTKRETSDFFMARMVRSTPDCSSFDFPALTRASLRTPAVSTSV